MESSRPHVFGDCTPYRTLLGPHKHPKALQWVHREECEDHRRGGGLVKYLKIQISGRGSPCLVQPVNLALARQVAPLLLFQHYHVALHPFRLHCHTSTLVTTYRRQSAHPSCHGSTPSPGYTQSLVGQENKARNEDTRRDHTTAPANKGRANDNSNKTTPTIQNN